MVKINCIRGKADRELVGKIFTPRINSIAALLVYQSKMTHLTHVQSGAQTRNSIHTLITIIYLTWRYVFIS